jgi:hypothetical protein
MLFSRRNKYKKARDSIQIESLDELARNRLWTAYTELVFVQYNSHAPAWAGTPVRGSNLERLVALLWMEVLHRPTDIIPENIDAALGPLRELHFKGEWHDVFDILEVLLTALPSAVNRKNFEAFVNASLAQEAVGYRLVNGQVLQLTQQEELDAIDSAIQTASGMG